MLQFWSITETTQKRQELLRLMVRSGKVCLTLGKDGKALVSGCARGCGVTHHGFCVWDCSLFCLSDLLHSHWSPPGTFFQPLLSARHPCCTTVIPLKTCSLSEIMGISTLASVLLLARHYVPFPMAFMFLLFNFHHLVRSVLTAHTHKRTGRHICTHMCEHTNVPERKLAHMQKYKLSSPGT